MYGDCWSVSTFTLICAGSNTWAASKWIELTQQLPPTEEFRGTLHQRSHFYLAYLREDTGKPERTELEIGEGLRHEWVDVSDALRLMRAARPTTELGRSVKERDLWVLEVVLGMKA